MNLVLKASLKMVNSTTKISRGISKMAWKNHNYKIHQLILLRTLWKLNVEGFEMPKIITIINLLGIYDFYKLVKFIQFCQIRINWRFSLLERSNLCLNSICLFKWATESFVYKISKAKESSLIWNQAKSKAAISAPYKRKIMRPKEDFLPLYNQWTIIEII